MDHGAFETYEEYLDSKIRSTDLYYLENEQLARQLVELGYRGAGEVLSREEFDEQKKVDPPQAEEDSTVVSTGRNFEGHPMLEALAEREAAVRSGELSTIVFVRAKTTKGHEISGYADLAQRLELLEEMVAVFANQKRFLPRTSDLSFLNWDTLKCSNGPSPYFQIVNNNPSGGLTFQHKQTRKVICVDVDAPQSDSDVSRTEIVDKKYLQVVFFDLAHRHEAQ